MSFDLWPVPSIASRTIFKLDPVIARASINCRYAYRSSSVREAILSFGAPSFFFGGRVAKAVVGLTFLRGLIPRRAGGSLVRISGVAGADTGGVGSAGISVSFTKTKSSVTFADRLNQTAAMIAKIATDAKANANENRTRGRLSTATAMSEAFAGGEASRY